MKRQGVVLFLFCVLSNLSPHQVRAQGARVPYSDCTQLAQIWAADLTETDQRQALTPDQVVDSFTNITQHVTCFASFLPQISRIGVLKALAENATIAKQQSSPSGSSGSTSSVSKPSGSTSLIQDVGGFSATSNGSALTLQFAPGDLLQNLSDDGDVDFCTSTLQTKGCTSTGWLKVFSRATFSATANTTTPGTPVSGSTANGGTVVPATLKSLANSLNFGGMTAKYALLYLNPASDGTAQPSQDLLTAASKVASSLGTLSVDLGVCVAYTSFHDPKGKDMADVTTALQSVHSTRDANALLTVIKEKYSDLAKEMERDSTCQDSLSRIQNALATVSAFQTAIAVQNVMANSSTPLLGLEYDFTTPLNKPSYHSAKLNLSWQSTVKCTTQVRAAAAKALKTVSPYTTLTANTASQCLSEKGKTAADNSGSTSATPNWTISASGGGDFYSTEPSSTIPSASHLRDVQAGAEITRVLHISSYQPSNLVAAGLLSKIGDIDIVGAYYYQDQTSPSILNGPPSSITFNGLPTTASQVFATRGPINVGQVRLGFGTGANIRFPIAVSYSNRSDLIVHPFVGVQFGVSYDLLGK